MILVIFTLIVLLLNIFLIGIILNGNFKIFHRNLFLILSIGIFYRCFAFLADFIFPEISYILYSIPLGFLYGPAFIFLLNSKQGGAALKNFWRHMIPFCFMSILYIIILVHPEFRYLYHQKFINIQHFLIVSHLSLYLLFMRTNVGDLNPALNKLSNKKEIIWYCLMSSLLILQLLIALYVVDWGNDIIFHRSIDLLVYFLFLLSLIFLMEKSRFKINFDSILINLFKNAPVKSNFSFDPNPESHNPENVKANFVSNIYISQIERFIKNLGFLDLDLSKDKFSQQLNIPLNMVSPLLKEIYKMGYSRFIIKLRLDHAAKMLRSEDLVYTIEELAFVCGFNSRASFYRNFFKAFGCSPHEYRQDQQKNYLSGEKLLQVV